MDTSKIDDITRNCIMKSSILAKSGQPMNFTRKEVYHCILPYLCWNGNISKAGGYEILIDSKKAELIITDTFVKLEKAEKT